MVFFLVLQSTYHAVELAFYEDEQERDRMSLDKTIASKELLRAIDRLLARQNIPFKELSFIAVNQGPGPFTTLRVVIATVNGLSFATKVPLVGVDGFDALLAETKKEEAIQVVLLNAFNRDVYYAIAKDNQVEKGYRNIDLLFDDLRKQLPEKKIFLSGNGTLLYRSIIEEKMGDQAIILPKPEIPSLTYLAQLGLSQWQQGSIHNQLQPIYLKRPL